MISEMTIAQLNKIGNEMFPDATNGRWNTELADLAGLSAASISNMRRGIAPITTKSESKILAAYDVFKNPDRKTYDFEGTSFGGDATFGLQLLVKDLLTNKFVGIHEVDPTLFFPALAPKKETVIPTTVEAVVKGKSAQVAVATDEDNLTDEEVIARINKRVTVMDQIADGVLAGEIPSMIVYGAPGIGKSFTIMNALKESNIKHEVIKGSVRAPGIIQALFRARDGGVVVFDDSDSVFADEESLNLLKAALDSEDVRQISWRKQSPWLSEVASENGVSISDIQDFEFKGGIIFITNKDLKSLAAKEDRMSEHFKALISRSMYIDLTIDTIRSKTLRVRDIFVNKGMAASLGLDEGRAEEVMDFVEANKDRMNEISLRMIKMVAKTAVADPENWKDIIEVTKMS